MEQNELQSKQPRSTSQKVVMGIAILIILIFGGISVAYLLPLGLFGIAMLPFILLGLLTFLPLICIFVIPFGIFHYGKQLYKQTKQPTQLNKPVPPRLFTILLLVLFIVTIGVVLFFARAIYVISLPQISESTAGGLGFILAIMYNVLLLPLLLANLVISYMAISKYKLSLFLKIISAIMLIVSSVSFLTQTATLIYLVVSYLLKQAL